MKNTPRPLKQKTIGILGGMSNQATSEYYRMLNENLNKEFGDWDNGEIIIVSVNFGNIAHYVHEGLWDQAYNYLEEKIERLERAGVDVIACVSNTMHQVVEPIMKNHSTPFIHIADPTGEAIKESGLKKVALLGTMPVMNSEDLKTRYLEKFGIEIVTPIDMDKVIIDQIIFDELVRRELRDESKQEYLRIIQELQTLGVQGVILGCTEIFLLISQDDLPDFPVFNTTALHVNALSKFALT